MQRGMSCDALCCSARFPLHPLMCLCCVSQQQAESAAGRYGLMLPFRHSVMSAQQAAAGVLLPALFTLLCACAR